VFRYSNLPQPQWRTLLCRVLRSGYRTGKTVP